MTWAKAAASSPHHPNLEIGCSYPGKETGRYRKHWCSKQEEIALHFFHRVILTISMQKEIKK